MFEVNKLLLYINVKKLFLSRRNKRYYLVYNELTFLKNIVLLLAGSIAAGLFVFHLMLCARHFCKVNREC